MTKLNDEQEALLAAVSVAKTKVDQVLETLAEHHARERTEATKPLRDAAVAAAQAGVPARRIGFALGTSDHKTITRYTGGLRIQEVD